MAETFSIFSEMPMDPVKFPFLKEIFPGVVGESIHQVRTRLENGNVMVGYNLEFTDVFGEKRESIRYPLNADFFAEITMCGRRHDSYFIKAIHAPQEMISEAVRWKNGTESVPVVTNEWSSDRQLIHFADWTELTWGKNRQESHIAAFLQTASDHLPPVRANLRPWDLPNLFSNLCAEGKRRLHQHEAEEAS